MITIHESHTGEPCHGNCGRAAAMVVAPEEQKGTIEWEEVGLALCVQCGIKLEALLRGWRKHEAPRVGNWT